jgi:predicted ATPase/Tfp pilus assembly protein PilF
VERVVALLERDDVRLVTLTGPGGVGKTRVALAVSSVLTNDPRSRVHFIELATVRDAEQVVPAIAQSLGLILAQEPHPDEQLARFLRASLRLLILDNLEQVIEAATSIVALLANCPDVKVLVTSRVVLRLSVEHEIPIAPLPAQDAVTLFVNRAQRSMPAFTMTNENATTIEAICVRLDGLPLAIELAAARVSALPTMGLLTRLDRTLPLLTAGPRDHPERLQTMRAAIAWSYDLLTEDEQSLFRRLSVFTGGCSLEAAEAVCNTCEDLGVDVLDGVASLVDNSLLVQRESDDGDPRFVMLETFREYGRERLLEHGEASATERAHAAYMLVVAQEETLEMSPAEREAWLRGCDVEHDNFRAAINWLITTGNVEWALQLGAALFRFWEQRDHLTEGRETLARVLGMADAAVPTRLRARALYCASVLADIQTDLGAAEMLSREACGIYRQFDDTQGVATTMTVMAYQAQRQGRYAEAISLFGEAVSLREQLGDVAAVDLATSNMAHAAKTGGNFDLARRLLEQVVASSQARGDVRGFAFALNGLGDVAASQGNHDSARRYHHESLARYREIDDRWGIARVLTDLASVDLQAGEYAEADRSLKEAVQAFRTLGHQRGVARHLESLSWCASCQSHDEAAVVLASAAAAIRHKIGAPAKQVERETIERTLAQARIRITAEAYANAWREGLTATLDRILGIETGQ